MADKKSALVLGIGNTLMRDDGLGVHFARAFERTYSLPPGSKVFDGGTGGLALLELIQGFSSIIVIDAVAADRAPGTLLLFRDVELGNIAVPLRPSAHQVGLIELLKVAGFAAGHTPSVCLIGVVPEDLSAGTELSATVEKLAPVVAVKVADELRRLNIECSPRPGKMHEISIIKVVLETVAQEMDKCGAKKLNRLTLRVGTLTAVEPEALRFAFSSSIEKTPLEGAELEIVESALSGRCKDCGTEYRIAGFDSACPLCNSVEIKRLTGSELDIISMDVD